MGRSSWQDYDKSAISPGGGIYSRSQKVVHLGEQARAMLGIATASPTPNEVMSAILKADADLLWFGGIGTYIRAPFETDADAGDRANDAVRITSAQVRAKVIGEGANLGVTQLGRIDFNLRGGRINSDAIDNSAGVNSSDLEVNIKIALGTLVRSGEMETEQRNVFLARMTDEVAELCLRNNYLQSLTISLVEREGAQMLADQSAFMAGLEAAGKLNRKVEYLPDAEALSERAAKGLALSRSELAVLLAYAKNTLYENLLTSVVPDDPYLAKELYRYFPDTLRSEYPQTIDGHRLRREVIATVLSNAMINRGGPSYVHRMTEATTADPAQVALAYAAARDSFDLQDLNAAIDALDTKVKGETQLALYEEVKSLLTQQTLWFLRNFNFDEGVSEVIGRYNARIGEIRAALSELLPDFVEQSVTSQAKGFVDGGTPTGLARRIAELSALTLATDIVLVSDRSGTDILDTARVFFALLGRFNLGRITEQSDDISLPDRFDRMALDRAISNLMRAQRDLTGLVLAAGDGPVGERLEHWSASRAAEIARVEQTLRETTEGELTVSRLAVAAGVLSDLARG
jgi:glutamate dehydrogenase